MILDTTFFKPKQIAYFSINGPNLYSSIISPSTEKTIWNWIFDQGYGFWRDLPKTKQVRSLDSSSISLCTGFAKDRDIQRLACHAFLV